jgi:hypothetical protein
LAWQASRIQREDDVILHHQSMYVTPSQKRQQMRRAEMMDRWAEEAKGSGPSLLERLARVHSALLSILL